MILTHDQRRGFDYLYFAIFAGLSLLWIAFYPRWFDRRVLRRSAQFIREGNSENMFGRREVELLPDKVHTVSAMGESFFNASSITKVVESTDALLLYVAPTQAVIVPKRKIELAEYEQAVAFAKEHYVARGAL